MQTDKNTHIHAHTASQTNKPGVRNNQSNNKIKKKLVILKGNNSFN